MDRELFFNEVSAYVSVNYPDIFLESINYIFWNGESFNKQRKKRAVEALSKYGIKAKFLPQDN